MKTEQTFSNGDPVNNYNATAIAEGFTQSEPTTEDYLAAWAYLIRTGLCWSLQGYFGRTATNLIESGAITPEGHIDWVTVDELIS